MELIECAIIECVKCGYCCTVRPCAYGKWDEEKYQCVFLTEDTLCAIYDEVKSDQSNPAMGFGCSSSLFNEVREKKIKSLKRKHT